MPNYHYTEIPKCQEILDLQPLTIRERRAFTYTLSMTATLRAHARAWVARAQT